LCTHDKKNIQNCNLFKIQIITLFFVGRDLVMERHPCYWYTIWFLIMGLYPSYHPNYITISLECFNNDLKMIDSEIDCKWYSWGPTLLVNIFHIYLFENISCMGMDRLDVQLVIMDVVWMIKRKGIGIGHS
jgi:hypothetical protein